MTDYPDVINIGECGLYLLEKGHQKQTDSVPILKQDQTMYILPVGAVPIKFTTQMGRTERHAFFWQLVPEKKGGEEMELCFSHQRISFEILQN